MADSLYLQIDGFSGTVAQEAYANAMEVGFFKYELNRATEPVSFSGLSLDFYPGSLANQFMQYATHGVGLGTVVLTLFSHVLNHALHEYTLTNASVLNLDLHQVSGSQGSPSAMLLLGATRLTYKSFYQTIDNQWLSRSNYYDFSSRTGG